MRAWVATSINPREERAMCFMPAIVALPVQQVAIDSEAIVGSGERTAAIISFASPDGHGRCSGNAELRTSRHFSSTPMTLPMADRDSPVLRAAAEKPPASATAMKAFGSRNRSIALLSFDPFSRRIALMRNPPIIIFDDSNYSDSANHKQAEGPKVHARKQDCRR